MAVGEIALFQDHGRSNWVRLRTLASLRWIAIGGQIAAVLVAHVVLRLDFALGLVVMTIGASVIANLFSHFLFPGNKRLSEKEATVMLVFDLLQLGLLLYLTGGLNNPFALLLLVPVTIAATLLNLRSTVTLALVAAVVISALAQWNLDVSTQAGEVLRLSGIFLLGFWVSLLIGVAFVSVYARQVTSEMHVMGDALLATQLALAREQKLTDLGGVVAAAAHELGTPLATIKLVAAELSEELSDRPDLREDADLISQQANRCRDILRNMGRAGKDDRHLHQAPVEAVLREAAEPHMARGKSVRILVDEGRQPTILRRPEIIHGLRNLIQNAVDFADEEVIVELGWTDRTLSLRIQDDGPGYPASILSRIGDPFVRRRRASEDTARRPGYEGMGLGLFIAKTLLERTGARLGFANATANGGAIVEAVWPLDQIETPPETAGLGDNQPIDA